MNSKVKEVSARLFDLARKHSVAVLAIAVVLFFVLVLFGPAFLLGVKETFSNRTIEKTKTEASAEKTAAEQEKMSAQQNEVERKAEDLNREQTLKPQRQRDAVNLAEASRRRQAAEDRYERNRHEHRSPDLDDVTLRRRNCAELAEIYPGRRFAGCQ